MFKNYFKTALRNLLRNKVYSGINILGLSIGLACGMLIILYVKDEVSFDRFHTNGDNIFRVAMQYFGADGKEEGKGGITGILQGPRFAAHIPEVKGFVRLKDATKDMKLGDDIVSQELFEVDSNFFEMFSFPLLSGNPKTALLAPDAVVISEDIARKHFGTTQAVGKTIMLKGAKELFQPYTVTAVAKRSPQNSSIRFEMLLPLKIAAKDEANADNWFASYLNTFLLLQPGADPKLVEAKMKKVYETDAAEAIKVKTVEYGNMGTVMYKLQLFRSVHLSTDYTAANGMSDSNHPMYSYILSGIALFMLLIACINFVNLTIARSLKRAKEIGVRKVVGGDRQQLMMQFMGESFLLSATAFILALLLVWASLSSFNELANKKLALSYLFDTKLVAGYILLFLVTTLLAGFYPSLVLSGYNPVKVLYNRFTLSGKNYLQKGLVVLQFTLASFMILATIMIYSQFNYLVGEKLGYDDSNLVTVRHKNIPYEQTAVVRDELRRNEAIADVAFKNGGNWWTTAHVNGGTEINFAYETVDESYLPMMIIPVVAGRNFSKNFRADSTTAVLVNEAFVKQAGWKTALDQEVDFWNQDYKKYRVVGVVKDYHYGTLKEKIGPQVFTMKPSHWYGMTYIKIKPGRETAALAHIENTIRHFFPISPYAYKFKDQENRRQYEAEARWKQIMLFSAILTIFISCIGLFGLSVLSAERRTKEIGIRKVLGASVTSVVRILSGDFLKLVMISLVLSVPMAWYAGNRWLENYAYRISISWWMFVTGALLVSAVALATISFYSFKAAMANPIKSLKAE